jgi:hypothetical protein
VLGCLNRRPAQRSGSCLGERARAGALSGLPDARREAGVADELARGGEAGDVADLRGEREAKQLADAGDRLQPDDPRVGLGQGAELTLVRGQALVEQVDQRQPLGARAPPDRGHATVFKELHGVGLAQSLKRQPEPPLGEQAEDSVAGHGAQADQVHPPPEPLAQLALGERGHPERRHQVPEAQFGEDPRVDLVGLAGQRRDLLDLAGVGDLDLPAGGLEAVAHPHGAAHHLNAGLHFGAEREHQLGQAILIGRDEALPPIAPASPRAHHAARPYAQSIPTYCIWPPWCLECGTKRPCSRRLEALPS